MVTSASHFSPEKNRAAASLVSTELFLDVGNQVVEMRLDKRVHTVGIDCIHETPPR
jgi:hypothetical protein